MQIVGQHMVILLPLFGNDLLRHGLEAGVVATLVVAEQLLEQITIWHRMMPRWARAYLTACQKGNKRTAMIYHLLVPPVNRRRNDLAIIKQIHPGLQITCNFRLIVDIRDGVYYTISIKTLSSYARIKY